MGPCLGSGEGVVPTSLARPDSCAGAGTAQSDPQNSPTTCGDGQRAQEMKEKGSHEHFAQLSLTAAQGSADYPRALAERRILFPVPLSSNISWVDLFTNLAWSSWRVILMGSCEDGMPLGADGQLDWGPGHQKPWPRSRTHLLCTPPLPPHHAPGELSSS